MFPEITDLDFDIETVEEDELEPMGKLYLYDFKKGEFIIRNGKMVEAHGIDALKVWIHKVLKTEYGRFRIYRDVEYGVILEDLIGSNHPQPFIEAEIKREVTTALLRHRDIVAIEEWTFTREGKWMLVWFRVITRDGAFDMEVRV